MSTAEPINEAQNLSSMADDVLRAILARARFDDQAALKRVCKRFLAVITSRAFREERRASGCLDGRAEGPARSLHVANCRIPWWTEVSGGSWTTLVTMRTNQYTTPIFAFDGEGAVARKSFAGLPCSGPGGMVWGLVALG